MLQDNPTLQLLCPDEMVQEDGFGKSEPDIGAAPTYTVSEAFALPQAPVQVIVTELSLVSGP